MELIFVRHGDPDYSIDSLTERGWVEAKCLVDRFQDMDIKAFYVSPLGRAKDTASFTLKAMNRTAEVKDWLREFPGRVQITGHESLREAFREFYEENGITYSNVAWDVLPSYIAAHPELYDPVRWREAELVTSADCLPVYDSICASFDELLAQHGYVKDGYFFRAEHANRDKIVFFCHFGLTCLLLSHLLGVSPFLFWQQFSFAPSSVTSVLTEERTKGLASFRINKVGDVSHLFHHQVEPAFACRFCETYDCAEERH